jgi:hybrid cluster-associated redox disulfide protein
LTHGIFFGKIPVVREAMDPMEFAGKIEANSFVQQVVKQYPQTIPVFARHGLQCVGCYISPFHTITDTAREYALSLDPLLADLNRAVFADAT